MTEVAGPASPAACPGGAWSRAVDYAATETTAIVALPNPKTPNIVTQPGTAKSARAVKGQVRAVDIGKWNQIPSTAANNSGNDNTRTGAARRDLRWNIGVYCSPNISCRSGRGCADRDLTRINPSATQVNVCVPTTNCWPAVPKVDTVIVPCACVHDVPIGSICPEKPSPPNPICH
jgi:hypothetical protein